MRKKKKYMIFILSILLGVGFTAYFFLNPTQGTKPVSVTESSETKMGDTQNPDSQAKAEPDQPGQKEEDDANKLKETISKVEKAAQSLFGPKLTVTAVGDSLTEGVGDETESGGYVGILEEQLSDVEGIRSVKINNLGKKGNRTDQLLERLQTKKVSSAIKDADIILITIGANDVMKVVQNHFLELEMEPFRKEQLAYEKRLEEIFETIRRDNPEAPIYLIGLFNPFFQWFSNIEELDQIIQSWNFSSQIIASHHDNIYYVPIDDIFRDTDVNLLYDDHFHPNEEGYGLIADRVLERMTPTVEAFVESDGKEKH